MRHFKYFAALLITISFGEAQAQVMLPEKYVRPTPSKVNAKLTSSDKRTNTPWNVFAAVERDGLQFMNRFEVTKENFDEGTLDLKLFGKEKVIRNVSANDLLLWDEALLDSKSNFRLKLLVITRIEDVGPDTGSENSVTLYKGPSEQSAINRTITAFEEYWFLYKQVGDWYLIGRASSLGVGQPDSRAFGWIRSERVRLWDKRMVLQPNMKRSAINERVNNFRQDQELSVSAFFESEYAQAFVDRSLTGYNSLQVFPRSMRELFNKESLSSQWVRWPVLRDPNNTRDIMKVGVVGKPYANVKFVDNERTVLSQELFAREFTRSRNIDVVFVIDATYSMEVALDGVKSAIRNIVDRLNSKTTANKFKFAAVLYTDRSELSRECSLEDCVFRTNQTLDEASVFERWLTNKKEYYSQDRDHAESMYEGLVTGLNLFVDDNHTNNLILIGDASGKDRSQFEDSVIQKMIDYRVSFSAVQAHNRASNVSYSQYQEQIRDIMLAHGENISAYLKNNTPAGLQRFISATNNLVVDNDLLGNRFSAFELEASNSPFKAFSQVIEVDKKITSTEMENFIIDKMLEINEYNNSVLSQVTAAKNQGIEALRVDEMEINPGAILDFYIKTGMDSLQLQDILSRKFLSLIEVYVPLRIDDERAQEDLLEYALFLDKEEFQEMRYNLTRLVNFDGGTSEMRRLMQKTWRDIAVRHLEPSTPPESVALSQIMEMVTGLPSTTPFLQNYTLKDLETISEFELRKNVREMRNKITFFLNREALLPKYKNGDQIYYWIPQRYLP